MDAFKYLVNTSLFIDKSSALKSILESPSTKFLFTRPRRWGKTSFMQMTREFLSMKVNQTGEEIESLGFGDFKNLQIVTQDRVSIEDIVFLFKNINKADNKIHEEVNEIYGYFKEQKYPWFREFEYNLSIEEKLERIHRLYINTRAAFTSSDEKNLAKLSSKEIEKLIEALRTDHPTSLKYYQLLSTFGVTCKHFRKYPTIFIEFPEMHPLQESPGSTYATIQETDIKRTISKAYECHEYLIKFLRSEIHEDDLGNATRDLETFQSYLLSQACPDESLNFLSKKLWCRYKIPIVVLFDEYDKPINTAYLLGEERFYQVRRCISSVFACLKNEESILYAFITGINRFAKADIFSGLNNLTELSILDSPHSDSFGFTAFDVKELVRRYNSSNPVQQVSYESLKEWYNNYQVNGTYYFNPFSVISCLECNGLYQPYWTESGNSQIILQLFEKVKEGKEEIVESLRQGEAEFVPLRNINWECMKEPTPQMFFSFLLHTGHLSLLNGQTVIPQKPAKFVVPNKEIRNLIDNQFMAQFYKNIVEPKCTQRDREIIVQSAHTNDFTGNLNLHCLNKIPCQGGFKKREAYFESVVFGIFFMEGNSVYQGEVQKMIEGNRIDSVFFPVKSNLNRIAVLHEYKIGEQSNNEKMVQNALWQSLTRSNLTCLSEGKNIVKGIESDWDTVKLRGIAFYPNMNTFQWCASSEEYTLSLDQVKRLLKIVSSLSDKNSRFRKEVLSGKSGSTALIEEQRALFLQENKARNLSELIQSIPFRYQAAASSLKARASPQAKASPKSKAGFSTVKNSLFPLFEVHYCLFDSPVRFTAQSTVSSWILASRRTSPHSALKVLDPSTFAIIVSFFDSFPKRKPEPDCWKRRFQLDLSDSLRSFSDQADNENAQKKEYICIQSFF